MCNCPAHFDLVDCVCECEHTYDRMDQWRDRAHAAEARLAAVAALCADRMAESVNGGVTDVDTLWPSEVLAALRTEGP